MAVNAYLIIDGVSGPSQSRTDAIDILSFSFGANMTTTYQAGSSGQESKAGRANSKPRRRCGRAPLRCL